MNKIRNELSEINFSGKISFNLYNEPLSDLNLSDIINEFRISCPNAFLQFNSNGDLANMEIIQNAIRAGVYDLSKKEYVVDKQDTDTLNIIMRSIYLQNSKNQPNVCVIDFGKFR